MVLAENDQVLAAAGGWDLARAAGDPDGVTLLKGMDHYTQSLMQYRMFLGMLTGAGLAPGILQPYMTLDEAEVSQRERVLQMELRHKSLRATVRMGFARHDGTPRWLSWNDSNGGGIIDFSHWGINMTANEEVFAPPAGLPRVEVRRDDLLQMIAALFDYALEAKEL